MRELKVKYRANPAEDNARSKRPAQLLSEMTFKETPIHQEGDAQRRSLRVQSQNSSRESLR
jgi:hypothetical protein